MDVENSKQKRMKSPAVRGQTQEIGGENVASQCGQDNDKVWGDWSKGEEKDKGQGKKEAD